MSAASAVRLGATTATWKEPRMTAAQTDVRHRPDPAGAQPLPMAIAVLSLPRATADDARRAARLDLALHAYKLGYFVVDILDTAPDTSASLYGWIETLALQTDADAFICSGPIDRAQIDEIAERAHMVVRAASQPADRRPTARPRP
jgi:hypothetical protein